MQTLFPVLARHRLAFVLAPLVILLGCSEQSLNGDGPGGAGGVGESVAEYFLLTRVTLPTGRAMYASILPGLDQGEVDLGEALELSGLSRVRAFDGKLYAFDGESGVATRYTVSNEQGFAIDELEDGSAARLSFTSFGISSFSNAVLFVDETQAFYFDTFSSSRVIEFNPTTMTLTDSFPTDLIRPGFDQTNIGSRVLTIDGHAVVSLSWTNSTNAGFVPAQAIGIVDLDDPTSLEIIEDGRCAGTSSLFIQDGYVYAIGTNFGVLGASFGDPDGQPGPCVLRWEPGSDAFDPDYVFDIRAEAGHELLSGARSGADGVLFTKLYVGDTPANELDLFDLLEGPYWQIAAIDLTTGETELAADFPPTGSSGGTRLIDGTIYVVESIRDAPTRFYRLDDRAGGPLFTVAGDIFRIERFR
ncbi:MAG: hypothetical protein AAF500_04230 [Myxococcota bacterium]